MTSMDELNRLIASVMPHEPRYRYYECNNRRFCWTVKRAEHKGKPMFVAFIRKEFVSKRRKNSRTFKVVKCVGFARIKVAKARAWMWYEKYRKAFESKI